MDDRGALLWVPVITVEKVERAKARLKLPDVCSRAEIHSAYLRLAGKWHPDRCRDAAATAECAEKFRHISAAWNFMRYLMEHYRYSLRYHDIVRYQESPQIQHQRRFGGGIWCGEVEEENRLLDDFTAPEVRVTAENVAYAAKLLGVLELTDEAAVKRCRRRRLQSSAAQRDSCLRREIVSAADLLLRLIKNYRYVLTPEAIRRDQESSLAWHRRQFDSEPLWAGGLFDDAFHRRSEKWKEKDGKFQGI